jgi:hypothetical protein
VVAVVTSYPLMQAAAVVLSILLIVVATWWIITIVRDMLRHRTPIIRDRDGVWCAARVKGRRRP